MHTLKYTKDDRSCGPRGPARGLAMFMNGDPRSRNSVTPPFGESGAVRTDRLFSIVQAAAAAGEFPVYHPAVPQGRVLLR